MRTYILLETNCHGELVNMLADVETVPHGVAPEIGLTAFMQAAGEDRTALGLIAGLGV